jgi:hypothetical protein
MRISTQTKVILSVVCFTLVAGIPGAAVSGDKYKPHHRLHMAGSYLIENLAIPAAGLADIQAMATLMADGGVVATDSDDFGLAATAPHSPKHGAWKRTGKREVSIKVLEFAYDAAGTHNFTWTLEFTGHFDDKSYNSGTGELVAKLFPVPYQPGMHPLDPGATPIFVADGTFDFRRITP